MIYESWNIRGIQADGRKSAITDSFSKNRPNIIGFQEIKKEVISDNYLNSLVGDRPFSWNSLPADGSAGGIVMGVDLIYLMSLAGMSSLSLSQLLSDMNLLT